MDLKRTPLYDKHVSLGAKIVPFAGFEMPVLYTGIKDEHSAVRNNVGLFDVSHMGEFIVSGDDAHDYLQRLTLNDVSSLAIGQAQYSAMCNENGGIMDDLIVYRFEDQYMLVVNASNLEKDYNWLHNHLSGDVLLKDGSDEIALVALQGPNARKLLETIGMNSATSLKFYHHEQVAYLGYELTLARTGYTGELGFELYGSPESIRLVWDQLLENGKSLGIQPVGLGARDTLRMEMKYCLYGNDIDETTDPYEAGLGWITKLDKGDFIGRDAIKDRKSMLSRRLVCFEMNERAVPRNGYQIFSGENIVGIVTSGTQSPSLQKGIGLAYINLPHAKSGSEIEVDIRGQRKSAVIVKPPFYKHGTVQE